MLACVAARRYALHMPVLKSAIDSASPTFQANDALNRGLVETLQQRTAQAALGGPEESRKRHVARRKLLPRDRVMRLLDAGSPFLETAALAGFGLYDDEAPGSGLITGIGRVSGREVMILANDATVKGAPFPHDREEASAGPGSRPAEPAALHLSGGFRRGQPAPPGRGVSRSRSLRPDFLQPGADERPGHCPDRLRHGLLHGWGPMSRP